MLQKIPGCETVRHLCETHGSRHFKYSQPTNPGEKDGIDILMHDIHPYLYIRSTTQMISITFCPYCGADIDNENRP